MGVVGTQRVVVYLAPSVIKDKIAKMRSLGSLRTWAALTKVRLSQQRCGPIM
jgi:hypothetical protein